MRQSRWRLASQLSALSVAVVIAASACSSAGATQTPAVAPSSVAAPPAVTQAPASQGSAAPVAATAAPASQAAAAHVCSNKTIGFAEINLTLPFFVDMKKASDDLSAAYGVKDVWQSADGSLEKEVSIVQNFIAQKVDAIAIDPLNANALAAVVTQATSAGIPVVTMGNQVPGIGNHNTLYPDYNDWVMQANILGSALKGQGTVLFLIGSVGNYVSDTRQAGFMDTMTAKFPKIKVLIEPTNFDSSTATSVTQTVLASHPDLAGVAAISDGLTLPALKVLQAAGKLGIPFVANDGDPQVYPYIEKGQVIDDILTGDFRVGAWNTAVAARLACGATFPTNLFMPVYTVMSDAGAAKVQASGVQITYVTPAKAQQIAGGYVQEFGPSQPDSAMSRQ